jgi:hypothetical protein
LREAVSGEDAEVSGEVHIDPGERAARRARARAHVQRQRRVAALAALLLAGGGVAALAISAGGGDDSAGSGAREGGGAKAAKPAPPPELPRGGRRLFPDFRVVAFYGSPRDPELGELGVGTLRGSIKRLQKQARGYERKTRPALPCLELISTVATAAPGPGGAYRDHLAGAQIDRHLREARKAKALLLLDVQPGMTDFVTETKRLKKWLKEPDVGLALDPEWRIGPGQLPGKVIGTVSAQEVNQTSAYVAKLVKDNKLPEKLFLVHQFTNDMVQNKELVRKRPGLATVFNVDGFGTQAVKLSKYRDFTTKGPRFRNGLKLFYKEDVGIFSPKQVMRLTPRPDIVIYE